MTDLLKSNDKDGTIVNEAIIALQSIINSSESGASNEASEEPVIAAMTRKQVILHCAKRLQATPNPHAKALMINLLSKQVHNFPTLAKETLRRLILSFNQLKSPSVKCQILHLA